MVTIFIQEKTLKNRTKRYYIKRFINKGKSTLHLRTITDKTKLKEIIKEEKKKMLVQDLKDKMKDITMEAEVIGKEDIWFVMKCNQCHIRKRSKELPKTCLNCKSSDIKIQKSSRARLKDKVGDECNLDLWDSLIEKVNLGDKIRIEQAMAKQKEYEENRKIITVFDLTLGYNEPEKKIKII